MSDFDKRLANIKENLENAKNLKIRSETRLEQLDNQKNEIIKEIENLGFQPDELDNEINKLRSEIEELLSKAEALIPKDLPK